MEQLHKYYNQLNAAIEGFDDISWVFILRARTMHNGYPIVHVDTAKVKAAWENTAKAIGRDMRKSIQVIQWGASIKMPWNMPYIAETNRGQAYLNEGNHTFGMLADDKRASEIDMVVNFAIVDEVREKYGAERAQSHPFPEEFLRDHKIALIAGLNLLQQGTVVDGYQKKDQPILDGQSIWQHCDDMTNIVTASDLIRVVDRKILYRAATSFLWMYDRYEKPNLHDWIGAEPYLQEFELKRVLNPSLGRRSVA